jgi:putative tricarboxylic transport membrane protein
VGPLDGLVYGFGVALTPADLLACFIGVVIGTIVGVLPGIGPVGAMALLAAPPPPSSSTCRVRPPRW